MVRKPYLDIEILLDNLTRAKLVNTRRESARQLGTLEESSEQVVRALLDARDADGDGDVRREAARALRASPHQEVLRKNIALDMRARAPLESCSALYFEAWELSGDPETKPVRWTVELSCAEASFRNEKTGERMIISMDRAKFAIDPVGASAPSAVDRSLLEGRVPLAVEGRVMAVGRVGYGKLMDWREKCAGRTKKVHGKRRVSLPGIGMVGVGAVQIAFSQALSLFWGIAFALVGGLNLVFPPKVMSLPNAMTWMVCGFWYMLFAPDPYRVLGYLATAWGMIQMVEAFRNR